MSVTLATLEHLFDEAVPITNSNGANTRFWYAKVRKHNTWFFVKVATSDAYIKNLENEYLWSEFMDRVAVLVPGMHLKGPHITQKIGRDALVFDYIDAPMVAVRGDASSWHTRLQRYTDTLVKLDKLSSDFSLSHVYTKLNHPFELDNASWRKWVEGAVDPLLIDNAKKVFKKYEWNVTLRLQHNDMSPWQIFEQGDTWIIIDGEKADIQSPRFNDVAQSYVRMHNTTRDPALAKDFLRQFMSGIAMDQTEFYQQFIPVLTMRAVGSLADAHSDLEHIDYTAEARLLVGRCLADDIAQLL